MNEWKAWRLKKMLFIMLETWKLELFGRALALLMKVWSFSDWLEKCWSVSYNFCETISWKKWVKNIFFKISHLLPVASSETSFEQKAAKLLMPKQTRDSLLWVCHATYPKLISKAHETLSTINLIAREPKEEEAEKVSCVEDTFF